MNLDLNDSSKKIFQKTCLIFMISILYALYALYALLKE